MCASGLVPLLGSFTSTSYKLQGGGAGRSPEGRPLHFLPLGSLSTRVSLPGFPT